MELIGLIAVRDMHAYVWHTVTGINVEYFLVQYANQIKILTVK